MDGYEEMQITVARKDINDFLRNNHADVDIIADFCYMTGMDHLVHPDKKTGLLPGHEDLHECYEAVLKFLVEKNASRKIIGKLYIIYI